jgi:hypothetical protein
MVAMGNLQEIDPSVIGILVCGALALIGSLMSLRWVLVRGFGLMAHAGGVYTHKDACGAANIFLNKLNRVRRKISLLDPYTVEYVHVFQAAGWSNIISLFESLQLAEVELDRRIRNRQFDQAVALAEFLCAQDTKHADDFISQEGFRFVSLVLWEKQVSQLLDSLLADLKKAAEGMQDIGVIRRRERAPTLMMVESMQRELLEGEK